MGNSSNRGNEEAQGGPGPGAAVIWLHGKDDCGYTGSWSDIDAICQLVANAKVLHPDAAHECGGRQAWFKPSWADRPDGLGDIVQKMHLKIDALVAEGVPAEKIIVGGFSQGGKTALHAGLRYPKRLGGVVAISGWAGESLKDQVESANKTTPVLFCYGSRDSTLQPGLSAQSIDILKSICGEGACVMEEQRSAHWPTTAERQAVVKFMAEHLQ